MSASSARLSQDAVEQQLRRACAELDRRLRAGDDVRAEVWLAELPELAADAELAIELIYSEYVTREALGQRVSADELCSRFPHWAERLRALLQMDALLQAEAETAIAPETPAQAAAGTRAGAAPARRIGSYEVLETLGHGGMGIVYKARHVELQRVVALKMTLAGAIASDAEMARLRREAQTFAQLQHPNIVQIYEVGEHEGLPFLALEYVPGGNLHQTLDGHTCPPALAVQLVRTLAQAIDYAHERGILHRDLKPANILVSRGHWAALSGGRTERLDGSPPEESMVDLLADHAVPQATVKITDFGLARDLHDRPTLTRSGHALGTPCYVPPEQAQARPGWSTRLVDVYSLGAILYEMLTGRPPFLAFSQAETLRQVIEKDPVPPSRLHHRLPRDLETICLKCLAKDPARRYPSAGALAEDLHRFLSGRPIQARPAGTLEKCLRWTQRKPLGAALIAVSVAAAVTPAVIGWLFTERLQEEVERTQKHAAATRTERDQANLQRERAQANELRATLAEKHAQERLDFAEQTLATSQLLRVAALSEQQPAAALKLLQDEQHFPPRLRDFAWRYHQRTCSLREQTLGVHDRPLTALAWGPRDELAASADLGGGIKLWDIPAARARWSIQTARSVYALAFHPEGKLLATTGSDGIIRLWQVADGALTRERDLGMMAVHALAWSTDGAKLYAGGRVRAAADEAGGVMVWQPWKNDEIARHAGHPGAVRALAISADGRRLAVGGDKGPVRLWDEQGHLLRELSVPAGPVRALAFAADGARLATNGPPGGPVLMWDWARATSQPLHGFERSVHALAFAPDGQRLAAAGSAGLLRIWRLDTGLPERSLRGHASSIQAMAYSTDGRRLLTGGSDRNVKLWDLGVGGEELRDTHATTIVGIALSADGKTLVTASLDQTVKIWDLPAGTLRHRLDGHRGDVRAVAITPDGDTVISAGSDRLLLLWDARAGKGLRHVRGIQFVPNGLALSADGKTLAIAGNEPDIRIVDVPSGVVRQTVVGHSGNQVACVAFGPGNILASTDNKEVLLWDIAAKEAPHRLPIQGVIVSLKFSPDGATLALGRADGSTLLWSITAAQPVGVLGGHEDRVKSLAWTADSTSLATAGADGTIRLWEPRLQQERTTLRARAGVHDLLFAPDDRALISAGGRIGLGEVRFWHATAR